MRKIYYILTVAVMLLLTSLTSCNSWLDITPRSEINDEKLFTTEGGFQDALIGSYTEIGSNALYGSMTTLYFPELLARHWPTTIDDKKDRITANAINSYDYSHQYVEPIIKNIWLSYYKAIAGLNFMHENLMISEVAFSTNTKELIEGEILGLRAFLHLDLLRYFVPIPDNIVTEKVLPYVLETSRDPVKLESLPYDQVIARMLDDLTKAEELLLNADPAIDVEGSINSLKPTSPDWYINRNGRFNYYAVLATKARLYQWMGDKENAIIYAKMVVESQRFILGDATTVNLALTNSNLVLLTEHIFSIHNRDTEVLAKSMYGRKESIFTHSGDNSVVLKTLDELTEESTNVSDIRKYSNYWKSTAVSSPSGEAQQVFHYQKYLQGNPGPTNRIPLIRLSEMYFILMENLPLNEGKGMLETFAYKRGMVVSSLLAGITTEADMLLRVEKEYRKDFLGEGQMFFFYKRLNYKSIPWPEDYNFNIDHYTIPFPDGQVSF